MTLLQKILSAFGITSATGAANRRRTNPNEWANNAAEHYAGVAAGVEINKRCSILSPADALKLENDFDAFTVALSGKIHSEFLRLARKAAKDLAADEPYGSCSSDARKSIEEAQESVAWWLDELTSHPGQQNPTIPPNA
ncbi:hypothetical protein OKA05_27570 [Luteolibacter arcticus]|uniref:Uncharacterized protein n=1 Tax=Luteolibacter arcticus TaxID=1581411 RepID=A0ABT3GS62_9BACT|nr:hypothetical protein [Luteolibacter arcticus]MCW1926342.1 hypothetical protein [Luteolibacter arcticus]